jgi:hypothetical protein
LRLKKTIVSGLSLTVETQRHRGKKESSNNPLCVPLLPYAALR